MTSATSATRVMFPKAATKSLHAYSWCSLPLTIFQPGSLVRRVWISASVNFLAGMAWSSTGARDGRVHYEPRASHRQDSGRRSRLDDAVTRLLRNAQLAAGGKVRILRVSRWPLNAWSNSIMVEVSFAPKIRGVRCVMQMDGGNREEEDSSDPIWHRTDRRVDFAIDAREASH